MLRLVHTSDWHLGHALHDLPRTYEHARFLAWLLDADSLDLALSALDAIQASGRTVGLISHIDGLAERIGVRVDVTPRGAGTSRVVSRSVLS